MKDIILTVEEFFGEFVGVLSDDVQGLALNDSLLLLFLELFLELFSHFEYLSHFLVKIRRVSIDLDQLPVLQLLSLHEGYEFIKLLKISSRYDHIHIVFVEFGYSLDRGRKQLTIVD